VIYLKSVLFGIVLALVVVVLCVSAEAVLLPGVTTVQAPKAEPSPAPPSATGEISVTATDTITEIRETVTEIRFVPLMAFVGFAAGFYWRLHTLRGRQTRLP
jgi:hypothetical protein